MCGSAKRGAKRSGRETQARLPGARNPAGGQVKCSGPNGVGDRDGERTGAQARGWGRSAQQALALRSGRGLRAARLPAPLWLLGTNSGQSHDAGAARSASLPGAGGGWGSNPEPCKCKQTFYH